jgi:heavy metal translocating P-type ATPase
VAESTNERDVVLDIDGMTCASCVAKVERALHRVDGVDQTVVNLATRTASVRGSGADMEALVGAVQRVGYGARPHLEERSPDAEYRSFLDRFLVATVLTVPVLVITFLLPSLRFGPEIAWALTTPVLFWAGLPFFRAALRAARHRTATMDTLVALGSFAAYGYSAVSVLAGGSEHYFDTAAVIVTVLLLGKALEARARVGASDSASALLERGAKEATLLVDGAQRRVPADAVRPGHRVLVMPGEKIPADGVVVDGASWIDLSLLTGESVPVDVGPGDDVVGAAINGHGRLVIFVTKTGRNSRLGEIVRALRSAEASKAPIQRLADRISAVFVPLVIALSMATFVGWLALSKTTPGEALLHAAAVLLIACPCALGLATPAAIIAGAGRAAQLGVLFKGGEVFEAIRRADVVLLDKTGTVTEGAMTLAEVLAFNGASQSEVLAWAAAAESGSEHPIAQAVVRAAHERGLEIPSAREHAVEPGAGASARVDGVEIRVGRPDGLPEPMTIEIQGRGAAGLTSFGVWREDRPVGLISVEDAVKPSARDAVEALRSLGLDVRMVTGDRRSTADAIAASVGIASVAAEIAPEGKVADVKQLQSEGRRVIFAGDGLNDGPALAQADVGIAMGSGTDVALAAADVNLLGGALVSIAHAVRLGRATYRVIMQNLFWAFSYNLVMIPLAVLGRLTPMWAAAAMAASSVSVVTNALRLRRFGARRGMEAPARSADPSAPSHPSPDRAAA